MPRLYKNTGAKTDSLKCSSNWICTAAEINNKVTAHGQLLGGSVTRCLLQGPLDFGPQHRIYSERHVQMTRSDLSWGTRDYDIAFQLFAPNPAFYKLAMLRIATHVRGLPVQIRRLLPNNIFSAPNQARADVKPGARGSENFEKGGDGDEEYNKNTMEIKPLGRLRDLCLVQV